MRRRIKQFWSWLCGLWWRKSVLSTCDRRKIRQKPEIDGSAVGQDKKDASHEKQKNPIPERSKKEVDSDASEEQPRRTLKPPVRWIKRQKRREEGKNEPSTSSPRVPRVDLLCRKARLGAWKIVIPDSESIRSVRQNGNDLSIQEGGYVVNGFTGVVNVVFHEGQETAVPLTNKETAIGGSVRDGTIIFKIPADWKGDGRRVPRITNGHHIVIAPKHFTRKGHEPAEPGHCMGDANFTAHYFYVSGAEAEGENVDSVGFEEGNLETSASRINIEGAIVFDNSKTGRLFVGDALAWNPTQDVVWMHVGEERKCGWKGSEADPRQALTEVLNGRQGRFFVRAYGGDNKLLDSEDFRYLHGLEEIRVNGGPYIESTVLMPKANGYPVTKISFHGKNDISVEVESQSVKYAKAQKSDVFVDPHPDGDEVKCLVASGGGRIEVVLDMPRIWWRLEHDSVSNQKWMDVPIIMSREEYLEHSDNKANILLRLPRKVRAVKLGIDDELTKTYPRTERVKGALVPLCDFMDHEQIANASDNPVTLHAEINSAEPPVPILSVKASPVPRISGFFCDPMELVAGEATTLSWNTQYADAKDVFIKPDVGLAGTDGIRELRPRKTTTYVLEIRPQKMAGATAKVTVRVLPGPGKEGKTDALVKRMCGWGSGKGFSLREIESAELTPYDASLKGLPIDRRRRSSHWENVKKLKEL